MSDPIFEDGRWLLISYECDCGCSWTDEWSCACDDECPDCGATVTASDDEDLSEDVQDLLAAALRRVDPAWLPTGLLHALDAETATADQREAAGELIRRAYDVRMARRGAAA